MKAPHRVLGVVLFLPMRLARWQGKSLLVLASLGSDALTGVREGKTISTTGRVTFVIAKRGTDWQIVQFHRSPVPN